MLHHFPGVLKLPMPYARVYLTPTPNNSVSLTADTFFIIFSPSVFCFAALQLVASLSACTSGICLVSFLPLLNTHITFLQHFILFIFSMSCFIVENLLHLLIAVLRDLHQNSDIFLFVSSWKICTSC